MQMLEKCHAHAVKSTKTGLTLGFLYLSLSEKNLKMDAIRQLIYDGKTDEAIWLLDQFITEHEENDEAWFLRGNAYRKKGDMRQALNNYLRAMELNPESPARQAHDMLIQILDYYNKETYNP